MTFKHILLWLPMILIAFANAMLREMVIIKHYSEYHAHQLSTITLIIFCALYVWLVYPMLQIQRPAHAWVIGMLWVLLTVIFEFALGRLTGKSWTFLLENYNLLAGRIWLIFLISLLFLPYLVHTIRNKI